MEIHSARGLGLVAVMRGSFIAGSALGRVALESAYRLINSRLPRRDPKSAAWVQAENDFGRVFHELVGGVAKNRANLILVMIDPDDESRARVKKLCAAEGVRYYQQNIAPDYHDRRWCLSDGHSMNRPIAGCLRKSVKPC
jgi:hypothetical protein